MDFLLYMFNLILQSAKNKNGGNKDVKKLQEF